LGRPEEIFEKIVKDRELAIDEFVLVRQSEELFLDFKRSSDNGSGKLLSQNDRENLAKAISGFGNSEGGIIVWGIDCSKDADGADVAHTKVPLENPKRFRSWLEGVVSGCTVPPHSGVRHHDILLGESGKGFVVTLIPKSNAAPHQTVGKLQYFMRAGSSFAPVLHGVLAGMFGRRPQPEVYIHYTVGSPKFDVTDNSLTIQQGYVLVNRGPGIARDLFASVWALSLPGSNCGFSFDMPDRLNWTGMMSFGRHISVVGKSEIRLPPRSQLEPIVMELKLAPPFDTQLSISGICGCDQAPPYSFGMNAEARVIEALHSGIKNRCSDEGLNTEDLQWFTQELKRWYGAGGSYDPYQEL
jgi:hypothetical protein